ncbi:hypothetical protein L9F63_027276, partial [Diploptera punctata]
HTVEEPEFSSAISWQQEVPGGQWVCRRRAKRCVSERIVRRLPDRGRSNQQKELIITNMNLNLHLQFYLQ